MAAPPDMAVGYASVADGGRVAYAVAGAGAPLVMVPGWLSHVHELWKHPSAASALAKLADGHRFIWYDRLGCGLSDRSRPTLSIDDDVAQLRAVLDALEVDSCDLIGYSFGGPAAARFTADNPDRVRHLVLYSTYARGADLADPDLLDNLVGLVRSGWTLAATTLAAMFLPEASGPDLRWFTRFQKLSTDAGTAADLLMYLRSHDAREDLARVRAPTTVVNSLDDQVIAIERAHELTRLVPGARLVAVGGRTHDPFIRDDGEVVEAILAAVEGRPLRSAPAAHASTRSLTRRETDVIGLVAIGASNKRIAAEFSISEATVERHLTNAYRKLGANGRADAAVRAIALGLVPAEIHRIL